MHLHPKVCIYFMCMSKLGTTLPCLVLVSGREIVKLTRWDYYISVCFELIGEMLCSRCEIVRLVNLVKVLSSFCFQGWVSCNFIEIS